MLDAPSSSPYGRWARTPGCPSRLEQDGGEHKYGDDYGNRRAVQHGILFGLHRYLSSLVKQAMLRATKTSMLETRHRLTSQHTLERQIGCFEYLYPGSLRRGVFPRFAQPKRVVHSSKV